jgi:hypothetical protein
MTEKARRYLDVGSRLGTEPAPTPSPEDAQESPTDTPLSPAPDTIPTQPNADGLRVPDNLPTDPSLPGELTTPEATSPANNETLYTDAEILGKHYPVRQMIREIGNQRVHAIESFTARLQNMRDTPAKLRLGLVLSMAQRRVARKQAKLDAVNHLSDRHILKRRRLKKLQEAQRKLTSADRKYKTHTSTMQKRVENIDKNVDKRRAKYRKELRARRETALSRRAMRHELRGEGASLIEVRAVLKDVPKEHLERVGKIAAVAYTSEQRAAQARKHEQTQVNRESRSQTAINTNRRKAQEAAKEAANASGIVEELKTQTIPKAQESLQKLREELDTLEGDDPAYINIQVQIQEVEERINIYENRELPYWEQVAHSNRERVATLDTSHTDLVADLSARQTTRSAATTNANTLNERAQAHANALAEAVKEAANTAPAEPNN